MKYFIFLLLILGGCQMPAGIEVPDSEKELVVNGLIRQDTIVSVHLSYSKPFSQEGEIAVIEDAEPVVVINGNIYDTLTSTGGGWYSGSVKLEGKDQVVFKLTYQEEQVWAETVIPEKPEAEFLSWQKAAGVTDDEPFNNLNFLIKGKGFYEIAVKYYFTPPPQWSGIEGVDFANVSSDDPLIVKQNVGMWGRTLLVELESDEKAMQLEFFTRRFRNGSGYIEYSFDPVLIVSRVSEDYYHYQLSVKKHGDATGAALWGMEPYRIYTNIQGDGRGIFAGYHQIEFK